jgi:hypothetical protein
MDEENIEKCSIIGMCPVMGSSTLINVATNISKIMFTYFKGG